MCEYTEGICSDGVAILKDGVPMPISAIVEELKNGAEYDKKLEEAYSVITEIYESGICLQELESNVRSFLGLST